MAEEEDNGVGYKRPPKASRFPKGASGYSSEARARNRAKKDAEKAKLIDEVSTDEEDLVPMPSLSGVTVWVPLDEVAGARLIMDALNGDTRSGRQYLRALEDAPVAPTKFVPQPVRTRVREYVTRELKALGAVVELAGPYRVRGMTNDRLAGHFVAFLLDKHPNETLEISQLEALRKYTDDQELIDRYFSPEQQDGLKPTDLAVRTDIFGPIRPAVGA